MKKHILSFLLIVLLGHYGYTQLSCTNATERTLTNYSFNQPNDSLFIICAGQTATLVATPPSGTPGWNFQWQQFNATDNTWDNLVMIIGVPVSTQSNLQPGGYRVQIIDGTNTEVGVFVAWVSRINTNPLVSVNAISPGCGNVQLTGQINNGQVTPYYNPPSGGLDPATMLIVDASTEITVCYTGTHPWVSDMGFFLVGPQECGSPLVTLSPHPQSNGQGQICNSNDNFNNLCFSTESTANFNPCLSNFDLDGLFPVTSNYTGTYGSYGPGNNITPINWSPLYGCTASMTGWKVQIRDCDGQDEGFLTNSSLSFSGISQGGNQVSYTYNTAPGFSAAINDGMCSVDNASTFTVPAPPPSPIYFSYGYEWTANPPFTIPNNTSSLNITLTPGPTVDTEFTLSITGNNPGAICGGTASATRPYDFQTGVQSVINPINTDYCLTSAAVNLTSNLTGGSWSGTGITNTTNGTFNPSTAGLGQHTITYTPSNNCNLPASITMNVTENIPIVVTPVAPICISDSPIQLIVDETGGTWSGNGVTNATTGIFDPAVAQQGNHLVQYHVPGVCEAVGMTTIAVDTPLNLVISGPTAICANAPSVNLSANITGGLWSGTGITDAQTGAFNPSQAGVGTTTITYIRNNGCQNSTTANVAVNAVPVINAGKDIGICPGQSTTLSVSGAQSYTWAPVTGLSSSDESTTQASPNTTTTYTVTGISNGCSANDFVTVIVHQSPNVTVNGPFILCPNESVQLIASGLNNYSWDNSSSLNISNVSNPIASPASTTIYTVTGTDNNGCSGDGEIIVEVIEIGFTMNPSEGLSPLEVIFTNQSVGDIFYWDFANSEKDTTYIPSELTSTIYFEDAIYEVILTVEEAGKTCSTEQTVLVYSNSKIDIIPNVVTADNSGKNDVFKIRQKNLSKLDVTIFNRYGNQVGTINSPDGFWNPRDNGDGTYYYVLKAEGLDGKKFEYSGHFTVVR